MPSPASSMQAVLRSTLLKSSQFARPSQGGRISIRKLPATLFRGASHPACAFSPQSKRMLDACTTKAPPARHEMSRTIPSQLPAAAITALFLATALALPLPADALSLQDLVSGVEAAVAGAGPLGPVLFIILYAVAAVFLIPGSVLTVTAGFLFGPVIGSIVVSIAATLGAAAAFLVGRYLARPWVAEKVASVPRFAAVDSAIAAQGAKIVLLLRLSPLFPYTLLNYALSLTAVPFGEYVLASWAGMLPGTVAYVALGGAGKAAAETAAGMGASPVQLVVYALGALGTLGATVLISRAAGKALADAEAGVEPLRSSEKSDD